MQQQTLLPPDLNLADLLEETYQRLGGDKKEHINPAQFVTEAQTRWVIARKLCIETWSEHFEACASPTRLAELYPAAADWVYAQMWDWEYPDEDEPAETAHFTAYALGCARWLYLEAQGQIPTVTLTEAEAATWLTQRRTLTRQDTPMQLTLFQFT